MADIIKEFIDALNEGIGRVFDRRGNELGLHGLPTGRKLRTNVAQGGGNGVSTQDFFTTGYDSVNKVTTVGMVWDFSSWGAGDIWTQ